MNAVHFCVVFKKTIFRHVKRWISNFANSKLAKFKSHQLFDIICGFSNDIYKKTIINIYSRRENATYHKIEAESLYHVDLPVNPLSGYVGPPDPRQSTVATRAESTIRQFILQQ